MNHALEEAELSGLAWKHRFLVDFQILSVADKLCSSEHLRQARQVDVVKVAQLYPSFFPLSSRYIKYINYLELP